MAIKFLNTVAVDTDVLYVDASSNRVGIGTASPSEKLEVAGTGELSAKINNTQYSRSFTITQGGGYSHLKTSHSSGVAINYGQGNAGILSLFNNTTQTVKINANGDSYFNGGNVGIGTTSPGAKLQIGSATYAPNANLGNNLLQIKSSSGFAYLTIGNGDSANSTSYIGGASGFTVIGSVTDAGALSEYVRITNSGNLGIGTTSPSYKLDVRGDIGTDRYIRHTGDTNTYFGFSDPDTIQFNTAGSERLRINSSGNVGIGTTSPQEKLHVYNAGVARIEIEGTNDSTAFKATNNAGSYGWYVPGANNSFRLFNFGTGSDLVTVNASGNVGIGTTSPGAKLHILSSSTSSFDQVIKLSGSVGVGGGPAVFFKTSGAETNDRYGVKLGAVRSDSDNGSSIFKIQQELSNTAGNVIGLTDTFTINQYGNVGIGTTSPGRKLEVAGDVGINGYIYHNGDDSRIGFEGNDAIRMYTANNVRLQINSNGNVGIGTTSPGKELDVVGTIRATDGSSQHQLRPTQLISYGTAAIINAESAGYDVRLNTQSSTVLIAKADGKVGIGTTSPSQKLEVNGAVLAGDYRGSANIYLTSPDSWIFRSTGGNERMRITSAGNIGVGTTSPAYKLDVNGGIQAGGKVTYTKSAGSLNTTGYAVAGITALPNGNGFSCGFTFTCFGHTGKYQKIVYSCYNSVGTWYTRKVIDEGTNDFDVEASADATTITFTFKSTSGTKSYTPRVTVEATGSAINSTYA